MDPSTVSGGSPAQETAPPAPFTEDNFNHLLRVWMDHDSKLPASWRKKEWRDMSAIVRKKLIKLWLGVSPDARDIVNSRCLPSAIETAKAPTELKRKRDEFEFEGDGNADTSATAPIVSTVPKDPEKRAAKYVSDPPSSILERIKRALSQRLYLIQQENSSIEGLLERKYAVLGSTGNVYNVQIQRKCSCTCPDHGRAYLCKHIIFVLLKVLKVPQNSPLIYQRAFLQSELRTIFEAADSTGIEAIRAKQEVVQAYKKRIGECVDDAQSRGDGESSEIPANIEGECPICFDPMLPAKETVSKCSTCRNFIHKDCLSKWLATSKTCCYCRSVWILPGSTVISSDTSYVNLGSLQGLPASRVDSNYRSDWSWKNRWGRGW